MKGFLARTSFILLAVVSHGAELTEVDDRGASHLPPVPVSVRSDARMNDRALGQALELFSLSPALFVENQGQWADPSVRYVHHGTSTDVAVTDSRILFRIIQGGPSRHEVAGDRRAGFRRATGTRHAASDVMPARCLQFSASFVGASTVRPAGSQRSPSVFHYHLGRAVRWRENVASYGEVVYVGLYEGIDLHVRGLRSHLKYEFHAAPGADHQQIAVRYEGIESLSVGEDGSLVVDLGGDWGVVRDDAPYVYQEIGGERVEVAGRFILVDDRTYSFDITGGIDPNYALVIDPDLAWSTYMGGSEQDGITGIAADASGNILVAGSTFSAGWTSGGFDTSFEGEPAATIDGFVVKVSPAGEHLWSTYVGGNDVDRCDGIAVDPSGNALLVGTTYSQGWTSGGFDTSYHDDGDGTSDAFAAKLSPAGAHVWSTYLGGYGWDDAFGIAADASGNVLVTGETGSIGWPSGGFDTSYNSNGDAYVVKLSPAGAHLWSTYMGGNGWDYGYDVAADGSANILVAGATHYADPFVPASGWVSGGFDTTHNRGYDAFVAKLTPAGGHLWSTFLGGADDDFGRGLAVDASGNVLVTGETGSSGWASGSYDTSFNGGYQDAFVAKLSSAGGHLWSGYLGGSGQDRGFDVATDASNNVYATGWTQSAGWVSGGFDTTYHDPNAVGIGWGDAFVVKFSPAGAHLWSTYLGGSGLEDGYGIVVDRSGSVLVAGDTDAEDWISGGFDTSYNGYFDAFVAKITQDQPPPPPQGRHDWNGDGIVSIVGDVPPFVQCVYFENPPGGVDTIAVGDCNHDGILSIVGDVPCFVECVYFGACAE